MELKLTDIDLAIEKAQKRVLKLSNKISSKKHLSRTDVERCNLQDAYSAARDCFYSLVDFRKCSKDLKGEK